MSYIGVSFKAKSVLTAGDVSKSGPYLRRCVFRDCSRFKARDVCATVSECARAASGTPLGRHN